MPLLSRRRSVLGPPDLPGRDDQRLHNTTGLFPASPPSPVRPVSERGFPASRLSREVRPEDVPEPPETDADRAGMKRFSMLKFRNFSESHLAARAKDDERRARESPPPMPAEPPALPAIVKTAPTMEPGRRDEEDEADEGAADGRTRPSLFKRSMSKGRSIDRRPPPRKSTDDARSEKSRSSLRWRKLQGRSTGLEELARLSSAHVAANQTAPSPPPSYGDEANSALALPVFGHASSDSSRSNGSNGSSEHIYGSTTTTTHTVSTHTTFFKLPRRNKNRNSLFPLPVKIPPPHEALPQPLDGPTTPRASTGAFSARSLPTPDGATPPAAAPPRRHAESSPTKRATDQPRPHASTDVVPAKQSLSFAEPGLNIGRSESQRSRGSSTSSPLRPPVRVGTRDRASTTSSFGRLSHDMGTPPPFNTGSGRTSTSTMGRSSLGGFLNLSRFRQTSDPNSPRHGSPGTASKSNSFAMSREALVVPEREEGDTPGKYLERLEAAVARSMIAGILSKSADPFAQAVLRSYTRRFPFFGEPIDMSLRKFLLEADLPKETQQVDRVVQAFADRYHECNPGIFISPDQAYIIAFSIMMLHTDAFNKNNKRKMQKQDYIKNTSGQQVSDDVLGCFYDNICYTPFVHYEEDVDINGERVLPFKTKKGKLKGAMPDSTKKPTGPLDPYNLLVDQKLDMLRPSIKESITMEDPYSYRGTQAESDPYYLQRAFTHTGVLQIISARSRPTAYESTNAPPNPMETQAGIIDLKITKVGTLWRKATKKKKARSPWQEWGAILTGSQMYLFKNAHWAKGLMHQFTAQQKHGQPRIPVVFKPPLHEFKPDALIKTDDAVALLDSTYTRHKHAFTFVRPGGQEEVFLADNETELNDWVALINYAAAFRAAGVRIRGMVGGTEEDLRAKNVARLDSSDSALSVQATRSANMEAVAQNRGLSPQLQRQVMAARRQIMVQKIGEAAEDIARVDRQLDHMLRNARHLLILAPIAPKTRDEVIHAAARADAMIKWTRRDMWKLKCHKDVLTMDVQQDGVLATELPTFAEQQAAGAAESAKAKARDLLRLNSKASVARSARSPPRTPTTPAYAGRTSVAGSGETYIGNDVFRTPPESATLPDDEAWQLPPLQLDVLYPEEAQHKGSTAGTLLSASPPGRDSFSYASSGSSAAPLERLVSPGQVLESTSRGRGSPTPGIDEREVEMMARTTMSPERMESATSRAMNFDGAAPSALTPDSKPRSGVRRSLQKTLRDAHHHQNSIHKHKRGKESDGTIRASGDKDEEKDESTPGLTREKGRFILHGKQASVIHFGSEWPNERMKMRREMWRQNSGSAQGERQPSQFSWERTDSVPGGDSSPVVKDFKRDGDDDDEDSDVSETDDETDAPSAPHSTHSHGFREDAEAAEAFATSSTHPHARTPDPERESSSSSAARGESASYFAGFASSSSSHHREKKRNTVIAAPKPTPPPAAAANGMSPADGDDGIAVEYQHDHDRYDAASDRRKNRDTVIGPSKDRDVETEE